MSFAVIAILSIVALGVVAALFSIGGKDEPIRQAEHDCGSCTEDCQLRELKARSERRELTSYLLPLISLIILSACSTKKNTPQSRWWQSFNARYNTYFNGSQAFIEGCQQKEDGNHDNYTELIPLYPVSNKQSRDLGSAQFDRAIEKSEKTIKRHSIKTRPEWNKGRRKTQKDIEWLSRREYNPFLWHAWLLLGKSQFQKGQFEEAAATFSYMSRLYHTQPAIQGIARAWQAKSYTELDWLYDAEDVIVKQRRDSMHFRAEKDWDYTYADYYIRSQRYAEAVPYLRKVIRHERRRKQKAREWYLMGQLQARLGHRDEAYRAFRRVVRYNPPYELEFNARIAQTEVLASQDDTKRMVTRLRRMASNDNNRDYQDQIYYAIGNIHLAQHDTLQAIEAYEQGNRRATRAGVEKGVLLLTLGNLYWQREQYGDARRCYGEAIGLLDQDRRDYRQLSERSKILDELAPHTDAVQLQDSLQRLAAMPEAERLQVIDRLISELKQREKEEQRARADADAEAYLAQQSAVGAADGNAVTRPVTPAAAGSSALWYFYNPQAVSQGKQTFQQQWGRRDNADNWQRLNKTVVSAAPAEDDGLNGADGVDGQNEQNPSDPSSLQSDSPVPGGNSAGTGAGADSTALDPHSRDYYLALLPFTDEQMAQSNALLADGLFHSGIIFKDRLDNLPLAERQLTRLVGHFADYEHNDEALYHLWLLYARQQRTAEASQTLVRMQTDYPRSQWTTLLSDPLFAENQRFGVHIEDSLYAATYNAFRADRYDEVQANARLSADRFPLGQHRPKFLFVEGLTLLNTGQPAACVERLQHVVDQYPQSEVSPLAGMIIRGVQQGRQLHGGHFDMTDVWQRRTADLATDSTRQDTLVAERQASYVFLLAYQPDSVNQNQLLFDLAKYNFTNYLVRNFEITVDQDANGLCRMLVGGFLSYDEALQYARQLHADADASSAAPLSVLRLCRSLIVSERNLRLLGTTYSYADYEVFFERQLAPIRISTAPLLQEPEGGVTPPPDEEAEEDTDEAPANDDNGQPDDDLFPDTPAPPAGTYIEFDDDFYR